VFVRWLLDTSFTSSGTASDGDPNRHGTGVAGIAMASGDNSSLGVAGVAWNGGVYPPCSGYDLGIIRAVDRCRLKRIPIVNMSFSSRVGVAATDSVWALNDVCFNAFISGVLLVAASGNIVDEPGVETPGVAYPAAFEKRVYAVGAMLPDGSRWEDRNITPLYCSNPFLPEELKCQSSNYGEWLDVIAPGGRLIVTNNYTLEGCNPDNPYTMAFGGASAAAPFVSGVASLLRASVPGRELFGEDIEQAINRTAYHFPSGTHTPDVGWGFVRANLARDFVAPPKQVVHRSMWGGPISHGHVGVVDSADVTRTFLNVPWLPSNEYTTTCRIYTVAASDPEPLDFAGVPTLWARASGTRGARDVDPYDYRVEVPWADCSLGGECVLNVGEGGPLFYTFVYKIFDTSPQNNLLGWLPTQWWNVGVSYTAVGTPTTPLGVEPVGPALQFAVTTVPNPARSPLWVNLSLPSKGSIRVDMLDLAGRRAAVLASGEFEGGSQRLVWNGRREDGTKCLPGVYWCRVEFEGRVASSKFVLLGGQP
jgi:hypothetical protein